MENSEKKIIGERPYGEELMVSIQTLVYNHASFLRECLEGIVMQKTNFRFEAIVHDDVSTDESAAIIREYAEKYPDIIKPIYETENQYSKQDGSLGRIIKANLKGRYIAFCEGDDYWTDPLKLQKQVDFLESHPAYSMCFANAEVKNTGEVDENFKFAALVEDRDYISSDFLRGWIVPTASALLHRDVYFMKLEDEQDFMYGDIVMWLSADKLGKVRGMSDYVCVYRIHGNGVSHDKEHRSYLNRRGLRHQKALIKNFNIESSVRRFMLCHAYLGLLEEYTVYSWQWWKYLILAFWNKPFLTIKNRIRTIVDKLR